MAQLDQNGAHENSPACYELGSADADTRTIRLHVGPQSERFRIGREHIGGLYGYASSSIRPLSRLPQIDLPPFTVRGTGGYYERLDPGEHMRHIQRQETKLRSLPGPE